jgi:hypothetical protein
MNAVDLAREGEPRDGVPRGCPGCQLAFCVEYVRMRRCVTFPRYLT